MVCFMKKISMILAYVLLLTRTAYPQFETKLSEELFITKLSDRVYVVTHFFPWESNSLIIKASDNEIVLIDTPYNNEATSLMYDWLCTHFRPEKIFVINTGFHIDNLGGNHFLRGKKIDIYGSEKTCQLIDERGNLTQNQIISWLEPNQVRIKNVYEAMEFVKPNITFNLNDGLFLKIGELSFDVYFPGESHSPDNVVVFIEECDLLFGGCMVKALSSKDLGFTGDANISEWPKSLKLVQKRFNSAQIVIPHHGMWGDLSLLNHTIELLEKQ